MGPAAVQSHSAQPQVEGQVEIEVGVNVGAGEVILTRNRTGGATVRGGTRAHEEPRGVEGEGGLRAAEADSKEVRLGEGRLASTASRTTDTYIMEVE